MEIPEPEILIREAQEKDFSFVIELMDAALSPYYGGDHKAHAKRIFSTHISGGRDQLGFFSTEQKMFILTVDNKPAGMIHIVGKRQGTYKISPLIVAPEFRGMHGLGTRLLDFAEAYARDRGARQIYCTVAEQNELATQFFLRKAYIVTGKSESHYKPGITELMLHKHFIAPKDEEKYDRPNISVIPFEEIHETQVSRLLLGTLPAYFRGIDESWVHGLFEGHKRRQSHDINLKYKLIFVAVDRENSILGVAGATPKKGEPIKVMPFIATTLAAFVALLTDIPWALKPYGRKLYVHITPSVEETLALQQRGWKLDAVMPAAYHDHQITQQWSVDIDSKDFMRLMRVKQHFFDLIKDRKKTLEVRVGYENINTIEPGERIRLASRTQTQVIQVSEVRRYATFAQMLEHEQANRIAPGVDKEHLLDLLQEIYPPAREALGVVVLEVQPER